MAVTPTAPSSLLDAVNELLRAIRHATVSTLDYASQDEAVEAALTTLQQISIDVLEHGWTFNTEKDETLTRDGITFEVTLPADTLSVVSARYYTASNKRLVERGGKLYDPIEHTYALTEDPVVTRVVGIEFADLPMAARAYITAIAGSRFVPSRLPTGASFRYTENYLKAAKSRMDQYDTEVDGLTMKQTSPAVAKFRQR